MNPNNEDNDYGPFLPETPKRTSDNESGSEGDLSPREIPMLLPLFQVTPGMHPSKEEGSTSNFVGPEEEQMNQDFSDTDAVMRNESDLGSLDLNAMPADGPGLVPSSGASLENALPLTTSLSPSEHETVGEVTGSTPLEDQTAEQLDPTQLIGARSHHNRQPSPRHGPQPKSSSFRGVTYYKRTGRWEAHIWHNAKQIYLGASSTAEKGARAYDRAALHFRGMSAELNFPVQDYSGELQRLVELSEAQLVTMLRKQSTGQGSMYPDYPPSQEL